MITVPKKKKNRVKRGVPSAVCLNLLHVLGLKENSVKTRNL